MEHPVRFFKPEECSPLAAEIHRLVLGKKRPTTEGSLGAALSALIFHIYLQPVRTIRIPAGELFGDVKQR